MQYIKIYLDKCAVVRRAQWDSVFIQEVCILNPIYPFSQILRPSLVIIKLFITFDAY